MFYKKKYCPNDLTYNTTTDIYDEAFIWKQLIL